MNLHHPGGVCPLCEGYDLVPVALAALARVKSPASLAS
jgi:hypothetical protein